MAFTAITTAQIASGEPTSQDLFQKIKDNFDDLDSRTTVVETANNIFRPIQFDVVGPYGAEIVVDGLMYDLLRFDITVLNVILFIHDAGASGTTTVDIEYKRGVGAFTSILSSPVSATSANGDYYIATATLGTTSLLTGDILRLNVDSVQVGATGFTVMLEFEVA